MLHEVKAQRPAEPLGGDEGLNPAEDLRLAGPVLVINLHRAAGIGGVQVNAPVPSDHVTSPLISLEFNFLDVLRYIESLSLFRNQTDFAIISFKVLHTWTNSDTK